MTYTGTIIPTVDTAEQIVAEPTETRLVDSRHPEYLAHQQCWVEWRLTYKAGRDFVNHYLEQFNIRESLTDFQQRKRVTPIPAFAKAAINDIKNSIFQRMTDTTRQGGPNNYQAAIQGNDGGIDRRGGSMNWFIGDQILAELLTMKKVGVFIDSPPTKPNETQLSRSTVHPYLYKYCAEDILNWAFKTDGSQMEFSAVLLRDYQNVTDPKTYLPTKINVLFRLMWIDEKDKKVHVQMYDIEDQKVGSEITLNLTKIPFVAFEITDSLLADAASYQIALLNLKSTDIVYAWKSNFPFYTEQQNPNAAGMFARQPAPAPILVPSPGDPITLVPFDPNATCYPQIGNNDQEITVGTVHGRKYPTGNDRPGFINPSTEPLVASMKLQDSLKEDIRLLINLALSNVKATMASAESKAMDQTGLESGLSYIGLELEHGERQIAVIWAMYEQTGPATVKYPERYSLKTDAEQQTEAANLKKQLFTAASPTFQKEMVKRIAIILLGSKVSSEILTKILSEIDNADAVTADPDVLAAHLTAALVSVSTASKASGYAASEAEKAAQDHLERIIRISKAQGVAVGTQDVPIDPKTGQPMPGNDPAARGIPDLSTNPAASAQEKQGKPQRGPAAGVAQ